MSATEYYDSTGTPATSSDMNSAPIRAEFDLIQTGFGKLPDMSGNGSLPVFINSGGTALETLSASAALTILGGLDVTNKDYTDGYAGLTDLKINFMNVAGTFTSFFTNTNTAARTYTFPDETGTVSLTSHTVASHADTTATGAELETLTDGSDAESLHTHVHDIADHDDTTATGAELETLTDGSDASSLHTHPHTVASHSDTTATGAELDTLTDDSMADSLHRHSELSASDGHPVGLSLSTNGLVSLQLGVAINEFSSDGTLADNLDTSVPTEKAVKTYVDASVDNLYNAYLMYSEQQTSGTEGGTFTQDVWQTRVLNTEDADTESIGSLSSNVITLPAGTYRVLARCPAYKVGLHKAQLYDNTGSAILVEGSSSRAPTTGAAVPDSIIMGRFTLSESSNELIVRHMCASTGSTTGFGIATSLAAEVYTVVEFWREA